MADTCKEVARRLGTPPCDRCGALGAARLAHIQTETVAESGDDWMTQQTEFHIVTVNACAQCTVDMVGEDFHDVGKIIHVSEPRSELRR